jgi:8-oxo-dGTP pyrophosphatase MutT (NUDIX family)
MTAAADLPPVAAAKLAAGALFFDVDGRVLLVKPTYKPGWEIPGGMVQPGESPAAACAREIEEELGLERRPTQLLVVDWAPLDGVADKLLFVFDGGPLPDDARIRLDPTELREYRYWPAEQLAAALPDQRARRVAAALQARAEGRPRYLEYGRTYA